METDKKEIVLEEVKEELTKEAKGMIKMSHLGMHIVSFIRTCKQQGIDPKGAIALMSKCQKASDIISFPIVNFLNWINDPTDENLQAFGKDIGLDFDEYIETLSKDREDQNGHDVLRSK